MTKGSMERVLQDLDRPAQPRQAFADELLASLLAELETPSAEPPPRLEAARHQARFRRPPRLLAAAAALVAIVVVISTVALWSSAPSALAVVRDARRSFTVLPEFEAEILLRQPGAAIAEELTGSPGILPDREVVHHVVYRDPGMWNNQTISNSYEGGKELLGTLRSPSTGDFAASDGNYVGVYTSADQTFIVTDADPSGISDRELATGLLDPSLHSFGTYTDEYFAEHCEALDDSTFLGRAAHRIRCVDGGMRSHPGGPPSDFEVLYDSETGMVLKVASRYEGIYLEVQSLSTNVEFDSDRFELEVPDGASIIWQGEGEPPDRFRVDVGSVVSASIPIGLHPGSITAFDGEIWASYTEGGTGPEGTNGVGTIVSIDPESNEVTRSFAVPTELEEVPGNWVGPRATVRAMAAAGGRLWAMTADARGSSQLRRVDPDGSTIGASLGTFGDLGAGIVGDGEDLWILDWDGGEEVRYDGQPSSNTFRLAALKVFDPNTERITATYSLPGDTLGTEIALGEGSVWVALQSFDPADVNDRQVAVHRVEAATGRIQAVIPIEEALTVAYGAGEVWVRSGVDGDGYLTRIDPATNEVTGRVEVGGGSGWVTVGGGSVWVTNSLDNSIMKIDPRSLEVEAEVIVGGNPLRVAVLDGSVWVTNHADGTISRVDMRPAR